MEVYTWSGLLYCLLRLAVTIAHLSFFPNRTRCWRLGLMLGLVLELGLGLELGLVLRLELGLVLVIPLWLKLELEVEQWLELGLMSHLAAAAYWVVGPLCWVGCLARAVCAGNYGYLLYVGFGDHAHDHAPANDHAQACPRP